MFLGKIGIIFHQKTKKICNQFSFPQCENLN